MSSSKLVGLLFVPLLSVGISCSGDGEGFDEVDGTELAASSGSLVQVGNNGSPATAFPLGACEGDCDNDNECASGLKCFQRDGTQAVPGCNGAGKSGIDYCYQPASSGSLVIKGDNGSPAASFPLGRCEGDCDKDSDCDSGLKCFQRSGTQVVPGCSGTGVSGKDYCYSASATSECEIGQCSPSCVCGEGEGDCDKDEDCKPGLYCQQQDGMDFCETDDSSPNGDAKSNLQVKLNGQWAGVCCNSGELVASNGNCTWEEHGRVLGTRDIRTGAATELRCPENGQRPADCDCRVPGERMHGIKANGSVHVANSLKLSQGAPIYPNSGHETCIDRVNGELQSRWSDGSCPAWRLVNFY